MIFLVLVTALFKTFVYSILTSCMLLFTYRKGQMLTTADGHVYISLSDKLLHSASLMHYMTPCLALSCAALSCAATFVLLLGSHTCALIVFRLP